MQAINVHKFRKSMRRKEVIVEIKSGKERTSVFLLAVYQHCNQKIIARSYHLMQPAKRNLNKNKNQSRHVQYMVKHVINARNNLTKKQHSSRRSVWCIAIICTLGEHIGKVNSFPKHVTSNWRFRRSDP